MLNAFFARPNHHKSMLFVALITLIALIIGAPKSQAQSGVVVGGAIAVDTVWSLAQSPYRVNRDIVVQQGATLTIDPGVVISFEAGRSLQVEGTVVALGEAETPIVFTSANATPQPGDWGHILFSDASADATYSDTPGEACQDYYLAGSIMRYTVIQFGGAGDSPALQIENASPVISCSVVQFNAAQGIYAAGTSAYLYGNYIAHNRGAGIFVDVNPGNQNDEAGALIDSNYIYNNRLDQATARQRGVGGAGLYIRDLAGYSLVTNNIIQDNTAEGPGGGVYAEGVCYSPEAGCSISIESNTLINNQASAGAGLYASGAVINNNLAQRNEANAALALGDPNFGGGGGMHARHVLTVTANVIVDNRNQLSQGGGLWVSPPADGSTAPFIAGNRIAGNYSRGFSTGGLFYHHSSGDSTGLIDSNAIVFNSNTAVTYHSTASSGEGAGSLNFGFNTVIDNQNSDERFNDSQRALIELVCDNRPCPGAYLLYNNNIINKQSQSSLYNTISEFDTAVDASSNWWGTTDSSQIDHYVYNVVEEGAQSQTNFADFLQAPEALAPVIPPENFVVAARGDTFELSWSPHQDSEVAGYIVYYDENPGHPYEGAGAAEGPALIDAGKVTNYTLTGLAPDKDYWFTITAYDEARYESWYAPEVKQALGNVPFQNGDFEQGYTGWNENYANLIVTSSALPDGIDPRSGDHVALIGMVTPAAGLTGHITDFSTELSQQLRLDENSGRLNYYYILWNRGSGSAETCAAGDISVWVNDTAIAQHDPCGDTRQQGWQLQEIDLSDYAGQTVVLRFRADVEDGAALALDDVSLQPASGGSQVFNRPPVRPGGGPAPQIQPPVVELQTDPILAHDSGPLVMGGELEVDQSGVIDFRLAADGLYARAPAGERGWPEFDSVTLAMCRDRTYYDDLPHDPSASETFCFQTDQGFIGKFRILDRAPNGDLTLEILVWEERLLPPPRPAAPAQPAAPPPASPQNPPFAMTTGSPAYERWGRPTNRDGCNGPYNDLQPAQRFKVEVWLTNDTGQTIGANWGPTFISAQGRTLSTCVFDNNNRAIAPGETVQAKFGAFVESNDWVQRMVMSGFDHRVTICFNRAGTEVSCQ